MTTLGKIVRDCKHAVGPGHTGLSYGDLDRNGNICTSDDLAITAGDVFLTEEQAERAQMFGWKVVERRDQLVLVRRLDYALELGL